MRTARRLLLGAGTVLAVVALSASLASAAPVMRYADEFASGPLDTSTWSVATPWNSHSTTGELQYYTASDVSFVNGGVRLTTEKRPLNGYAYTSAILTSLNRPKFGYGYFEMRAKLPEGKGIWPAFWLTNDKTHEIDVFELLGDDPTTVYMTYHRNSAQVYQSKYTGPDFSAGYHTFGVDWQPTYIRWYVDGILRGEYTGTNLSDPLYIVANTSVGGAWPSPPDATTPFPQYYDIDYVRAYDSMPAGAGLPENAPKISSAGFSNSVAYDIKSLLTTRFTAKTDQDNAWARLVVKGARSDGGDLVLYDDALGAADTDVQLATWNGTNELGQRVRYSGNYRWSLTLTKGGLSTEKTGNITVSRILFNVSSSSTDGSPAVHTGYMIPGAANLYIQATTPTSDSLSVAVDGPVSYFDTVGPYGFSSSSPLNTVGRLNGSNELTERGIHTITVTGQNAGSHSITVLQ